MVYILPPRLELLISLPRQVEIPLRSALLSLLKSVQYIDSLSELGHMQHSMLDRGMDSQLAHPGSYGWHRSVVMGFETILETP
jgi:hypothetical protein